ncbi:TIGR03084 family metal-binding protein [Winogradskya consettensis]|uniref:Wyosine base formation n=1 Tax=Winogradskya consettensis TaxID=113560 RepID=A0A919VYC4_9ACTN|nr:TIGR03084 family metal-binding protein [Actinoplanes consettensis]GIM82486.1 wyosine base formation [Actinoplanes consettensis]
MVNPASPTSDLAADCAELDALLGELSTDAWATPTPAPGWTVQHQVAHLCAVFRMAATAAGDPAAFKAMTAGLSGDFDADVTAALSRYLGSEPSALLARWRVEWNGAVQALAALPPDAMVPWLVRPLPAMVLAGAGMMEVFGHGQDIADAVGVTPVRTDRVGHLVNFAHRTWDFGFQARNMRTPSQEPRFEVTAPSGKVWAIGPDDADTVSGDAVDLCLLVTRRRHRNDLRLSASGPAADLWLDVAQAYRGPAGEGRRPGQFASSASR